MLTNKVTAEGMVIDAATPVSARRMKSGILLVTNPEPSEKIPRTETPPMNANSIQARSAIGKLHRGETRETH